MKVYCVRQCGYSREEIIAIYKDKSPAENHAEIANEKEDKYYSKFFNCEMQTWKWDVVEEEVIE